MLETARRYYPNEVELLELPYALGHGVTLYAASQLSSIHKSQAAPSKSDNICVSISDVEERNVFSWFYAFEHAIHFHAGITFGRSYTITRSGFEHRTDAGVHWSYELHSRITENDLRFATQTLLDFEPLMLPETFNRVSNAIRLYDAAQRSSQPDFALLGFIGCLESLFSVATQELNFRLCLTISRFTRDTAAEQQRYFTELKQLYTVRSKIAHGDKLLADEERAAVRLVDYWVPTAAAVCREAILRLFTSSLVEIFNSRKHHERLLEHVVFHPNLDSAVSTLKAHS